MIDLIFGLKLIKMTVFCLCFAVIHNSIRNSVRGLENDVMGLYSVIYL
jgi:hypothetical protein